MMLYPSVAELMKKVDSRYLLVNVVARLARDIAENAEANGESLQDKPVSIAINKINDSEATYHVVEE